MSRSGKDFFGEYEKYGGEYEDMIREEIAALQEEEERLTEILEEKQKEYKDGDKGEIRKLQEKIDEIGKEKSELLRGANDAKMMEEIEEVQEKSPYWAERYEKELKGIREAEEKEMKKLREADEKGEEYIEPYPDVTERKIRLDTKVEMAKGGLTPDEIGGVVQDYDGMLEHGIEYFESKENLSEQLDKVTFEEADEILEEGRREGKYSDENYRSLKGTIRRHYGK